MYFLRILAFIHSFFLFLQAIYNKDRVITITCLLLDFLRRISIQLNWQIALAIVYSYIYKMYTLFN